MSTCAFYGGKRSGSGPIIRLGQWLQRVPRMLWLLAALAVALSSKDRVALLLDTPGQAIRSELKAAAGELRWQVVAQPNPAVVQAMRAHFREHDVIIDPIRFWPQVAVTVHGLDRRTCRDAAARARRIDGRVVVRLEAYDTPASCGDVNDMTWRIMP